MAFTLDNARYLPCYITECEVESLSTGNNTVCEIKDRELRNRMLRVQDITLQPNENVTARIRQDTRSIEESNSMNMDYTAKYDLHCKTLFYLNLYNSSGGAISNYWYRYGYWLFTPTVADKILYKMPLTDEEKAIATEFDLERLVDEGSLPLPMDTMLKRVFKRTKTATVSWHGDLTTDGADVGSIFSPVGKMLVLESVALERPPDGTHTTALNITVDERSFHSMRAWAAAGAAVDIPLWIIAKDSIKLSLTTNNNINGYDMRFTYSEFRVTKYIEVMFGAIAREENEDIWKRIRSGLGPE